MAISVFDIFKIGIGPSSSHTVGPMKAARQFAIALCEDHLLDATHALRVELFGSLGATGRSHGSDSAILLGLLGEQPDHIDPDRIPSLIKKIRDTQSISVCNLHRVDFRESEHLVFHPEQTLPLHANGMRFSAFDGHHQIILRKEIYSIGGGFIADAQTIKQDRMITDPAPVKFPFANSNELLALCARHQINISQVMLENEQHWRGEPQTRLGLLTIWQTMQECVKQGCSCEGILPGTLQVKRRAAELYRVLSSHPEKNLRDPLTTLDWVNLYALAVNEENAAGRRVVTAPTNGAAGIIPAVLHYYTRFIADADDDGVVRFLLTAGAIALLYKLNASISGAEVGCQGEIGVACSMAAGALTEVLGGTPAQVENAAEIGMEHNLGLTCDPVEGLVQIPCIERNAMGAVKAINAARMALRGDGRHFVSLDQVIKTMRETGADMKSKYKETALGGLAVNVVAC